jgi:hypothetical protein
MPAPFLKRGHQFSAVDSQSHHEPLIVNHPQSLIAPFVNDDPLPRWRLLVCFARTSLLRKKLVGKEEPPVSTPQMFYGHERTEPAKPLDPVQGAQ